MGISQSFCLISAAAISLLRNPPTDLQAVAFLGDTEVLS